MKLKEYLDNAPRTNKDLGSKQLNVFHMVIGLHSEFNEMYDAVNKNNVDLVNISEEFGDSLWYLGNYCVIEGIHIDKHFSFQENYFFNNEDFDFVEQLEVAVSKLTDVVKKENVYNKEVQSSTKLELVIEIFKRLNDCYTHFGMSPEESMEKNINKLKIRYPEKFTDFHATNRNLEAEYETLK